MPGCNQLYATPVPARCTPQNRGFPPSFPVQARSDVTIFVTRTSNPADKNRQCDHFRPPASRRLQTPCQPGWARPPDLGVTARSVPIPSDLTPRSGGGGFSRQPGGRDCGPLPDIPSTHHRHLAPSPSFPTPSPALPGTPSGKIGLSAVLNRSVYRGVFRAEFRGWGKALPMCRDLTTPARLRMMGA